MTAVPAPVAGLIAPAELSVMIWRHRLRTPDPCRVCAGPMTIDEMKPGGPAVYRCELAVTQYGRGPAGDHPSNNVDHYVRSQQTIVYHGDQQVARIAAELRGLRAERGEDMTVPVGQALYLWGHGKWRCLRFLVHQGDDDWAERADPTYQHDPAHAEVLEG